MKYVLLFLTVFMCAAECDPIIDEADDCLVECPAYNYLLNVAQKDTVILCRLTCEINSPKLVPVNDCMIEWIEQDWHCHQIGELSCVNIAASDLCECGSLNSVLDVIKDDPDAPDLIPYC